MIDALRLSQRLSLQRLAPYLDACGGDLERAIRLYEWNSAVSAALFEVLADVEVVLRNAIHSSMTEWSIRRNGGSNWFDDVHGLLEAAELRDISKVRLRIEQQGKPLTPERIVSELSFGFWRFLLTSRYRTTVWPILAKGDLSRVEVGYEELFFSRVGRVHDLRNRIAHHESIHRRRIDRDLLDCLRIVVVVCPETAEWVKERARVADLLENRPQ